MAIRLAVLGLGHETNTFSNIPATLAKYEDGGIHRGLDLVDQYASSQATFAGFLAGEDADVELVPLLAAWINPCGAITTEAYERIFGEMLNLLKTQGPFDGVLLGLHGAAVAENELDVDGAIAAEVRELVGPRVPIAAVIDMHANVSQRFVDALDLLFPYQTNPHVDARDRGFEAKQGILEMIRGGTRPQVALRQIPLVVTITKQDTSEEPMAALLAEAREIEAKPGVIDASILEGFPYADVPQMGMSVVVTHDRNLEEAQRLADALAEKVWDARAELQGGGVPVAETIAQIRDHELEAPLLVLDVGDNVGGGGPGDSTVLLQAAISATVPGVVGILLDPEAVDSLADASVGARVSVLAGGKSDEQEGEPILLEGLLRARTMGQFEEPKMAHGGLRFFDTGPTVAIETDAGVTVILTSKLVQPITPAQLRDVGLDPAAFRAILAKGVNGPRAGYADVTDGLLVSDTPGVTRLSVEKFVYQHQREEMYPYSLTTRMQFDAPERNSQ